MGQQDEICSRTRLLTVYQKEPVECLVLCAIEKGVACSSHLNYRDEWCYAVVYRRRCVLSLHGGGSALSPLAAREAPYRRRATTVNDDHTL